MSATTLRGTSREVPMAQEQPPTPCGDKRRPIPWRCPRCGRFLGTIRDRVLHEGANRSALPVVRACACGRKCIRLT